MHALDVGMMAGENTVWGWGAGMGCGHGVWAWVWAWGVGMGCGMGCGDGVRAWGVGMGCGHGCGHGVWAWVWAWGVGMGCGMGCGDGVRAWGVGMGCGHGVWAWGVGMGVGMGCGHGCGHGVWGWGVGWGVGMGCGHGVWAWGVGMGCGHGVWAWGVGMGCGHGVGGWGVGMGCGHGVWGWGVGMGCGHGVWGWGVGMGCENEMRMHSCGGDKAKPRGASPRRRSGWLVLVLVVLVAAAAGAGYYLWREYSEFVVIDDEEFETEPPVEKVAARSNPRKAQWQADKLWSAEELAKYNGSTKGLPLLLGILGDVFDVTKGRKHYGKGQGYNHFAGRDATRAFVSGNFSGVGLTDDLTGLSGDGLTDDLTGLSGEQCIGIADWWDFYFKTYIPLKIHLTEGQRLRDVAKAPCLRLTACPPSFSLPSLLPATWGGWWAEVNLKLVGWFYNEQGKPKDALGEFDELLKEGKRLRDVAKVAEKKYPGCNSRWAQKEGGKVRPRVSLVVPPCFLPAPPFLLLLPQSPVPIHLSRASCERHLKAQGRGEAIPRVQLAMGAERGRQGNVSPSLLFPRSSLRCASLSNPHSPLMVRGISNAKEVRSRVPALFSTAPPLLIPPCSSLLVAPFSSPLLCAVFLSSHLLPAVSTLPAPTPFSPLSPPPFL
ncbi:unnamed protein product [Closterium sp. Naga37s-1]|nr:unnamed protein product [Closterium sp. Naga37s-1]